jgi:raffinose/stachyose/melibiose transport system permease protein
MRAHRPLAPYLFIAPALAVFGFAVLMPFVFTGAYSLTDWDGYSDAVFVGVDNYVQALGDTVFQQSFVNVVVYILVTLVVEVLLGLVLAGIAISVKRGSLWFRVAIFTPVMLPMVVVAVLWSFVYNPDFGLVNGALRAFGLEDWTRVWLGDEQTALLAICVVSGWVYAGFYMTIFFAALRQVPTEIVEAARLDGAKESTIFWRVRVPIIRTSIEVAILLCITGGFQSFDLFYVLTNGGPYHSTEIPTTYLVQSVFHTGQVGYGSAMAVVLTAVVVAIGLAATTIRRRGDRDERTARTSTRNAARNAARNATPQPAPTHSAASLSTEKELVR